MAEETKSEDTQIDKSLSDTTDVPPDAKEGEPKPEESKPEEVKPEEQKPEDSNPEEPKPEEVKPEDSNPEEPKPEEVKPEESTPEEPKPEDAKPEELKPKDTNPEEDTKPEEAKPEESKPEEDPSLKEESNLFSDLKESEKKALLELRAKLQEEIRDNKLFTKNTKSQENKCDTKDGEENQPDNNDDDINNENISLWGVPLSPLKSSESTNTILLKFLRARDFKPKEALDMIKSTLQWRSTNNIETILDETLTPDLNRVSRMDSAVDREGHPICYNLYGAFSDKSLYEDTFESEESTAGFLRWQFQLMEKGIKKLDFRPGGASSILQITDLKNTPWVSTELRSAMRQAVTVLQDNYPEFAARNIFINVPLWYYAFSTLFSPFLTQRTKSKFVFARPSRVTETLLRYIVPEQIPVQYGGLRRSADFQFFVEDGGIHELTIKANSIENIEIPITTVGESLLWDISVVGWEVGYKEEFVPDNELSYTVIILKEKKYEGMQEALRNSYRNLETGKVVLTVNNNSMKKRKVFYRSKMIKYD